jgi:hypothetical protein
VRAHWLKGIGHARASLPEAWLADGRAALLERTGFPRRPRIAPGDRLVYYAAGWRRVFAVVEVVSEPTDTVAHTSNPARWPWSVAVEPLLVVPQWRTRRRSRAIGVAARSMSQQSHIRLSPEHYERAWRPSRRWRARGRAPRSARQVVAEAVVRRELDELEAGALVQAARLVQDVVGPQRDPAVAGALGEAQALLDQARADAAASGSGLDEQQAQLGDVVLAAHAQNAADRRAVDLGDPRSLAAGVALLDVVGHDPCDERLEALVPSVLLRVEGAVALDDPAEVAGAWASQDEGAGRWSLGEHVVDGVHRGDKALLVVLGQRIEDGGDLVGGAAVELGEGLAPSSVRRTRWRRASSAERSRATRPCPCRRARRRLRKPASMSISRRRSATSVTSRWPSS